MNSLLRGIAITAACVILAVLNEVHCIGVFEVQITDFQNPKGQDSDGRCCSGRQDAVLCKGKCFTFFRLCLTHVSKKRMLLTDHNVPRLDANTPCSLGTASTEVAADRTLFPGKRPLAVNFTFSDPWPGKFSFIIEAWHSSSGIIPSTEDGRLIIRFASVGDVAVGSSWNNATLTSAFNRKLSYSFRVTCSPGFARPSCSDKCDSPSARFLCTPSDQKTTCRDGWSGDECDVAVCHKDCHKVHGYCHQPGECTCRLGWKGEFCDQCVRLPGCRHGSCNKSFECNCHQGWQGFFCNRPICKEGCHSARGYCSRPGQCSCRFGWQGQLCDECQVLPGCVHGNCTKPLECICRPGWKGLFCNLPVCQADCHPENGFCVKPNECRCRVGWYGKNCTKCFPYPGCQHGSCHKPWECNCEPGWGGMLCDEKLDFCSKQNPCKNDGKCISKTKEDGYYRCSCIAGFSGRNCELVRQTDEDV